MSFAFVFPGQGSQSLKMMDKIKELDIIKHTFNQAKNILDVDFLEMLDLESVDDINKTVNTQPLMLVSGYATYLAWYELTGKVPEILAGHSLGEWTALVVSGVIDFADALKLVKLRAEAMQDAVEHGNGAMAAVLGLDDAKIIEICDKITEESGGVVAGVNFNSPGQVVIAGDKISVELAGTRLKENGAKRVQLLPVSVPSHCSLMKPAADKLAKTINDIMFNAPKIPIVQNVDAQIHQSITLIKDALIKQLYSPVLWSATINNIVAGGVTNIIECGPGKILTGLNKRINSSVISFSLMSKEDILTTAEQIN